MIRPRSTALEGLAAAPASCWDFDGWLTGCSRNRQHPQETVIRPRSTAPEGSAAAPASSWNFDGWLTSCSRNRHNPRTFIRPRSTAPEGPIGSCACVPLGFRRFAHRLQQKSRKSGRDINKCFVGLQKLFLNVVSQHFNAFSGLLNLSTKF